MARRGLKFEAFLTLFHRRGDNPTLAMARAIEPIARRPRMQESLE